MKAQAFLPDGPVESDPPSAAPVDKEPISDGPRLPADVSADGKRTAPDDVTRPEAAPEVQPSAEPESTFRLWSSADGKFKTAAEFRGMTADKVKLLKVDGTEVTVPLDMLSPEDQAWVRNRR
jgi:hypothetical protein